MNASRQTRSLFVCLIAMICSSLGVTQTTINVPADQPTIQAGIDAAAAGDRVLVAPGTYFERINFKGKAITVKSSGGSAVTTMNGSQAGSVVTFDSAEGPSATLDGFTISNGRSANAGGGITVRNSSPTIQNNVITANGGIAGLGIWVLGGSPIIQDNTITNNVQNAGTGGSGGGISLIGASNAQVLRNTIANNRLAGGGDGGGIGLSTSGGLIAGNTITGNYVYNGGGGIASFNDSFALIVNNVIANNTDNGQGSGHGADDGVLISVPSGSRGAYFINNTLVNNSLYIVGSFSNMLIENNLIATSSSQPPIYCSSVASSPLPLISNNDFFSFNNVSNGGDCSGIAGTNGNISANPLFIDLVSDFHLALPSPAIDSGNNSAPGLTTDLEGNPRIVDGDSNGSTVVDMGALEANHPPTAAQAIFTPRDLVLPDQMVEVFSAPQVLSLTNVGSVPAQLTKPAATGDFFASSDCPLLLPIGISCNVFVSFLPTNYGSRTGELSFGGNFGSSPPHASISGKGLAADAVFSPTLLVFGDVFVGTTSDPLSTTLRNAGNIPLVIGGFSVPANFAQTNDCPSTVQPGSHCQVSVNLSPTTPGFVNGHLTVSSNSFSPSSITMAGTGQPLAPVQLSPSVLDFGHLAPGSTSKKIVTLTVNSSTPQHISGISLFGPRISGFSLSHGCGSIMVGGQSCEIAISFTPTAVGPRFGTLQVVSDAGTQFVSVQGFGSGAALTFSNTTLDLGTYWVGSTTSPSVIAASNTGDQPLHFAITSTGDFFVAGTTCPNPLPGGAQCLVSIQFQPTASGPRKGKVIFTDDALNSPQVVALAGVGLDYSLVVSPSTASVEAGNPASYSLTAWDLGGNYGVQIHLSCTTNAPAAACSLAAPSFGTGQPLAFTVVTTRKHGKSASTAPGTYIVSIQGASTNNHTASASLVVKKHKKK